MHLLQFTVPTVVGNNVTKAVSTEATEARRQFLLLREPRSTSMFTQFWGSVQCRFTSTETIRTVRDGEPRTATSIFTQLLNSAATSSSMLLNLRPQRPLELLRPQRPYGLSGTGAQDGHLHFHTAPELCCHFKFNVVLRPQRT